MNTDELSDATKASLLAACKKYVGDRIDNALQAIASASDAAADDTKSSAGDKFETTREMMQQELNRHQQLLADAQRMEQVINNLNIHADRGPAKLGSLVATSRGMFFIAISMGQLQIDGTPYWVISPASPLGQQLVGMEVGQQVVFNGTTYQITDIA